MSGTIPCRYEPQDRMVPVGCGREIKIGFAVPSRRLVAGFANEVLWGTAGSPGIDEYRFNRSFEGYGGVRVGRENFAFFGCWAGIFGG